MVTPTDSVRQRGLSSQSQNVEPVRRPSPSPHPTTLKSADGTSGSSDSAKKGEGPFECIQAVCRWIWHIISCAWVCDFFERIFGAQPKPAASSSTPPSSVESISFSYSSDINLQKWFARHSDGLECCGDDLQIYESIHGGMSGSLGAFPPLMDNLAAKQNLTRETLSKLTVYIKECARQISPDRAKEIFEAALDVLSRPLSKHTKRECVEIAKAAFPLLPKESDHASKAARLKAVCAQETAPVSDSSEEDLRTHYQ